MHARCRLPEPRDAGAAHLRPLRSRAPSARWLWPARPGGAVRPRAGTGRTPARPSRSPCVRMPRAGDRGCRRTASPAPSRRDRTRGTRRSRSPRGCPCPRPARSCRHRGCSPATRSPRCAAGCRARAARPPSPGAGASCAVSQRRAGSAPTASRSPRSAPRRASRSRSPAARRAERSRTASRTCARGRSSVAAPRRERGRVSWK